MADNLESFAIQKVRRSQQSVDRRTGDPLGDIFHLLKMNSVFYTRSELTAPWGMEMPAIDQSLMFHIVVHGHCYVEVEGEKASLSEGDFVMVPHGLGHCIFDHATSCRVPLLELPIESLSDHYEVLSYGGKGEQTVLICGAVSFDHPIACRLLALMPNFIKIDSGQSDYHHVIHSTMSILAEEAKHANVGGEAVITRLADILVIQSLRAWLALFESDQNSWLAALRDKRLSKAMLGIHHQPEVSWTVESLANEAGMSRTTFAEHFKRMVGDSPLNYLTQYRMTLASRRLIGSRESVLDIALSLGYQSEAAFSRAYKKQIGVPPSTTRKCGKP